MLIVEIKLFSEVGAASSFDFGHLIFRSEKIAISSEDGGSRMKMMIFLSLVELLDGLRGFLIKRGASAYEFVGVGSSFIVLFEKKKDKSISIKSSSGKAIETKTQELARAVYESCNLFWKENEPKLAKSEAVLDDFGLALSQFYKHVIDGAHD